MLNGAQIGQLRDAINNAFDKNDFIQMLKIRLDRRFTDYAEDAEYPYQIFQVIQSANREPWYIDLINALLSERPQNPNVLKFCMENGFLINNSNSYNKSPDIHLANGALQNLINANPFIDPEQFIRGLSKNKKCICRIQIFFYDGRSKFGTGFLVNSDTILSNYHVFEDLITKSTTIEKVICKFDYEIMPNGVINPGIDVNLHSNPILAYSKYCEYDAQGSLDVNVDWPVDCLDYALIRLDRNIGAEAFGSNSLHVMPTDQNKRGWITLEVNQEPIIPGGHMFILQHPDRQPIKLAIGFESIIRSDENNQRVRYNLNTLNGSSGSPCFSTDFKLVALHNMGDPEWNPQYNQGIVISRIVEDLNKQGVNF